MLVTVDLKIWALGLVAWSLACGIVIIFIHPRGTFVQAAAMLLTAAAVGLFVPLASLFTLPKILSELWLSSLAKAKPKG